MIIWATYWICYYLYFMILPLFRFWAEICQIFRCFFGKSMTPKRHSEINWPLGKNFYLPCRASSRRSTRASLHSVLLDSSRINRLASVAQVCVMSSGVGILFINKVIYQGVLTTKSFQKRSIRSLLSNAHLCKVGTFWKGHKILKKSST